MKGKLQLAAVVSSVFILSGCGISGAPECSGSDVIDVVKQIATNRVGTDLLAQQIVDDRQNPEGRLFNLLAQYPSLSYDDWRDNPPMQHQEITAAMDFAAQQLSSMTVSAIRTLGMDEAVQKISCGGQVDIPGFTKSYPVEYTAQYTEDGQVWVEAYGLE